jgi:phosphoserine phosphatase RsbU/P
MKSLPTVTPAMERIVPVIFEYAAKIGKEQDISALIGLNADLARDMVGAERCSLWLLDQSVKQLWTKVAHEIQEIRIAAGEGIVGACVANGQTYLVNDPASDPRFLRSVDDFSGYHTRSILCVPLNTNEGVIGALQLLNKPGGFSEDDAELLRFMGVYAASAIQTERLRQEAEMARFLRYEIDMAAGVQRRLLPQYLVPVPGIEYAGLCRPARFVGGDYYDFLQLPDGHFGITLGDVSGKGFPAAVLMASIHTLLHASLQRSHSNLAQCFVELNAIIHNNFSAERYSTLFCGTLNAARDTLVYVNAGHVPPVVVKKDGSIVRPADGNLPVGLMPTASYQQSTISLAPGDLFVCISDGLVDAQNCQDETWDDFRLEAILYQLRNSPPKEVVTKLIQAVDDFAGRAEQFDDMTAIAVRIGS